MMPEKQEGIMQIIHNPKVGAAAATAAGGIGLSAIFSFFAPIIGFITAFLSAVLVAVLIYKGIISAISGRLDIKMKKMKIEKQEKEVECRKERGLDCRRSTDNSDDDKR